MNDSNHSLSVQIVIVGGGIAGLWLLNRLSREGYDAVLLEKDALGAAQTLASQGIIHGGLKYALNGVLSPASSAIADMPARWRACLAGEDLVDLRGTRLLSPHYYMWSSGSVRSRLKTFLGSKALRGRIDALSPEQFPAFFASQRLKGALYQLTDFVVDTPSLLHTLAAPWRDRILQCSDIRLIGDNALELTHGPAGQRTRVQAQRIILCAGEGNEALLNDWQAPPSIVKPFMQRRPLHMVSVRLKHAAPAYLHCIGDNFGMTPRLTITSHPVRETGDASGAAQQWIWYLGGELAESGVSLDAETQQRRAQMEIATLFPWVNLEGASWHSFLVNRAEPRVADLQRPDTAWVSVCGNIWVCWPTKLTLSPDLGDRIHELLAAQLTPANGPACDSSGHAPSSGRAILAQRLPAAGFADSPWEFIR